MSEVKIIIPEKVNSIIKTLEDAGYEAYAVGGCIRDIILGREPRDWDITTSALPQQVKSLFRRTVDTGIKHGTVTVMIGDEGFEVTTYRVDGIYEDGRHPRDVSFTRELKEDLRRRDFTINAMAYNDRDGLVDIYGGMEDTEKKIIRCVGEPEERFGEDALRMLRAIRFSAQLGYEIDPDTEKAISKLSGNLKKISAERIHAELIKTLVSDHPEKIEKAYELGLTAVFLPEFDTAMQTEQNHPHHCYSVGKHIIKSICEIEADPVLRLAMLLHDIGKPKTLTIDEEGKTHFHGHPAVSERMGVAIMRRLKMDNDTIRKVSVLVRYHDYGNALPATEKTVRRALNKIGDDLFEDFLKVKEADVYAQSDYLREEKIEKIKEWRRIYREIIEKGQCFSIRDMKISGKDLIAAGTAPGPALGEILNKLLEEVLDDPEKNNREYLLKRAGELKSGPQDS